MSISQSSKPSTKRRIVLVDDHAILLEGLQQMIDHQPDLRCSATASSGDDALKLLQSEKPDLLIVDISMPGRSGLELIKDVVTLHQDLPILVLSMHDEGLYAQRVLKAGARGYVMKEANSATLLHAMRTLLNGGRNLSPAMSACLLDAFLGKPASRMVHGIEGLSDREFEVFRLLGEGQGTADVAKALNLSPKTVDVHRANIRTRLKLKNGAAVVRYAVRWVENQKLGLSL